MGDPGDRVAAQVRDAWLRRVPFVAVLGDRELAAGTVALRTPGGEDLGAVEQGALRPLLERRCAPPPA